MTRKNSTTKKAIQSPNWDKVRDGDLITLEKGMAGDAGHVMLTERVNDESMIAGQSAWDWKRQQYRVTAIIRDVPDTSIVPTHAGALAFTDEGLAHSDGDDQEMWSLRGEAFRDTEQLKTPVEALPVPAKELRNLWKLVTLDYAEDKTISKAASLMVDASRREWERAGLKLKGDCDD